MSHGTGKSCMEMVDLLSDYIDGELDSGMRRLIEEHEGECPPCRSFIRTLARTVEDDLHLEGGLAAQHRPAQRALGAELLGLILVDVERLEVTELVMRGESLARLAQQLACGLGEGQEQRPRLQMGGEPEQARGPRLRPYRNPRQPVAADAAGPVRGIEPVGRHHVERHAVAAQAANRDERRGPGIDQDCRMCEGGPGGCVQHGRAGPQVGFGAVRRGTRRGDVDHAPRFRLEFSDVARSALVLHAASRRCG